VAELLPKVEYAADESIPDDLDLMTATVVVTLKDGRRFSRTVEKLAGWMGNPLTPDQQRAKFLSCARPLLDEKTALRMLELVNKIEMLPDVSEIMDIARCDGRKV